MGMHKNSGDEWSYAKSMCDDYNIKIRKGPVV